MKPIAAAAALALTLAACSGEKPKQLPADPVDRAATCAAIAAGSARVGMTDVRKPLPIEAQGRILHYAMLAASEGGTFQPDVANQVSRRMSELVADATSGNWQTLVPACAAAYPAAEKKAVTLPANRTDALLACDEVASFLLLALDSQNSTYSKELSGYRELKRTLDRELVPGLRARAGSSPAALQAARHKALAQAAALGSPVPLLDRCGERFGKAG